MPGYEYRVGDLVMQVTPKDSISDSVCDYYPECGVTGIVKADDSGDGTLLVQWEKGSTFLDDCWWIESKYIAPVDPSDDSTFDTSGLEDLF